METLINTTGRGTMLVWSRVQHAGNYIVGHIKDNAGYYGRPQVYRVTINAHGGEYVTVRGDRVYITGNTI